MEPLDKPPAEAYENAPPASPSSGPATAVPVARPIVLDRQDACVRPVPPGRLGLGRGLTISLICMGAHVVVVVSIWVVAIVADKVEFLLRWGIGPAELVLLGFLPIVLIRACGGSVRANLALTRPRWSLAIPVLLMALSWVALFELLSLIVQGWAGSTERMERLLAPLLMVQGPADWIRAVVMVALAPAVCEELVFRGLFQQSLQLRMRWWSASLISAAAFAVFHLDPLNLVGYLLLGWCLSVLVARTGCLGYAVFVHFWTNLSALLLANVLPMWVRPEIIVSAPTVALFAAAAVASMWLFLRATRPAPQPGSLPAEPAGRRPRRMSGLAWAVAVAVTGFACAVQWTMVTSRRLDGWITLLTDPRTPSDVRRLAQDTLDREAADLSSQQRGRVREYAVELVVPSARPRDPRQVQWARQWLRQYD